MKAASIFHRSLCILTFACAAMAAKAASYDPLAVLAKPAAAPLDLTVHDAARNRDIPIRVYLPAASAPAPVVIFSHGLGGSRENNPYLGEHWAGRGYVGVFLQHAGSDNAVWQDVAAAERMAALKKAASAQNLVLRVQDVPVVLDQLALWNKESGHPLAGRLDLSHIGMSGHSFGAQTTQGVSGQTFPGEIGKRFTDPRIRAAVMFSPNAPTIGDAQTAFGAVTIPWMLMTGTKDVAFVGTATVESREAVFPALPPGDKYEVVLDKAEHSAFSDRALPGDREPRNPNHHRAILALSTAFWDAYLKDDKAAKAWLNGDAPRGVLEQADRWQKK
ncbi:MAG: dienelactone hydrolase [Chthoniobacter sp.]|uniref:alpha/beta hydrolase family protein n=1 Tax=Chthoniobacter sp. TaxID=2510640 RepID=UPI0032AC2348